MPARKMYRLGALVPLFALFLSCTAPSQTGTGTNSSMAQKSFLESVDREFRTYGAACEAFTYRNDDGETLKEPNTLLTGMTGFISELDAAARALEELPAAGTGELEDIRADCAGHIRIHQLLAEELASVVAYYREFTEVSIYFDQMIDDPYSCYEMLRHLADFKQTPPPPSLEQFHDGMCDVLEQLGSRYENILHMADLNDAVLLQTAKDEAAAVRAEFDGLWDPFEEYYVNLFNNQTWAARLEQKKDRLGERLDEMTVRYGASAKGAR